MRRLLSFAGLSGVLVALVGMAMTLFSGRINEIAIWHFAAAGALVLIYIISRAGTFFRTVRSRQAMLGAVVSVYTLLVVGIVVVINVIGAFANMQIADLTEGGLYTLSKQTTKVLDSLKEDLNLHAFFRGGRSGLAAVSEVDRLLRTFEAHSNKVHLSVVDPELDPTTAEKFGIYQDATLVLKYGDKSYKVNTITEETLTNTLLRMLDDRPKTICFSTGHGEPAIKGNAARRFDGMIKLRNVLKSRNYDSIMVDLSTAIDVPPECTVVAVTGPVTPLATGELALLDNYLLMGGRVLVAQDASSESGLNGLLERWGVKLNDDVILEKLVEGTLSGGGGFRPTHMKLSLNLWVTQYNRAHSIAQDLSVVHPTQFQKARSIGKIPAKKEGLRVTMIFHSKKESWGEKHVKKALAGGKAILNPKDGDMPGPLPLAAAVSFTTQSATERLHGYSRQARLVVIGSTSWMQNLLMDESRNFNPDLALNVIEWLAGMEEFLAIGSRSAAARSLFLRYKQKRFLFNSVVVFMPEFFLLFGLLVWWIRR